MPDLSFDEALKFYEEAVEAGFVGLADKAKRLLCKAPLSQLPDDTLEHMSVGLLMEIVGLDASSR